MKLSNCLIGVLSAMVICAGQVAAQDVVKHLDKPLAGYYAKNLDCDGIMIRSADVVDDKALLVAAAKIRMMLAHIPVAQHNLQQWGAEIHIIGQHQQTSDLPEFAMMKGVEYTDNLGNKTNIDIRTRGMGGLYTSCGEENLLGLPGDRYPDGQDICIHEFAHNIMNYALDDSLRNKIKKQYESAKAQGLWKDAYAMVDAGEYWAELSMWYFGKHGEYLKGTKSPAPGFAALKAYDPRGYALLDAVYSGKIPFEKLDVGLVKSVEMDTKSKRPVANATLLLCNKTLKKYKLFWINYQGQPEAHGELPVFNLAFNITFLDAVWQVQDDNGKVVANFRADKPYTKFVIE